MVPRVFPEKEAGLSKSDGHLAVTKEAVSTVHRIV
jgi:hypothetical protein